MNFLTYDGKEWPEKPQLKMRWPRRRLKERLPTEEKCRIREYQEGDETQFLELMTFGDFDPWDETKLSYNLNRALPGGWLFGIDESTERAVGTIVCLHNYGNDVPFCGEIGWLCCRPECRGKGFGAALTVAATNRFLDAGYSDICLRTEYFRLPAIKVYLEVGYVPIIDSKNSLAMWREACEALAIPFTPDHWENS